MERPWVTFFSQTGKEIVTLSDLLGRWPDLIITNERPSSIRSIDERIPVEKLKILPNRPVTSDYESALQEVVNPLITLHGWLRIVPEPICRKYEIVNGHPGLITEYPQLKGKDPQYKAFMLGLEYSGSVIHKVTQGVDEGSIIDSAKVSIAGLDIKQVFATLSKTSIEVWKNFLESSLKV